jgi:two-component system, NarL family, sensor histidine kinase UhpB
VERFSERTRIAVDYRSTFDGRLGDETETHLFRIVQEAFTNIARHSEAKKVSIYLRAENGSVKLTISDDGHGLAEDRRNGMGLSGMRARARSAGGELKLTSKPGEGVTIEVWAPRTVPPTQS